MGLFKNFPYTNFHELNLDWFYSKWHDLFDKGNAAITGAEDAAKDAITAANGATVAAGNAATAAGNAATAATSANSAATAATSAAARAESAANSLYAAGAINLIDNSCFVFGKLVDRGGRMPTAADQSKTYTGGGWVSDRWSVLSTPTGGADGGQLRFSSSGVQAVGAVCWLSQWIPAGLPAGQIYSLSIYKDADYSIPAVLTSGTVDNWSDVAGDGFVESEQDGAARVWIKIPTDHWVSGVALRPGGRILLPYVMPDRGDTLARCAMYLTVFSSAKPARECKASSSGKYLMYFPEMIETPSEPSTMGSLYVASTSSLVTLSPDAYTYTVKDGPYIEVTPTSNPPTVYSVVTIWPSLPVNLLADHRPAMG